VLVNTRLLGHYAEFKTVSGQTDCFDKCDEDPRCAAASLTVLPDISSCRLFKFGFDMSEGIRGTNAYIKPEVSEELLTMSTLNEMFPVIRANTKLVNPYDMVDALTPSQCFKPCTVSRECAAASFTTETKYVYNCYMYKKGQFREDAQGEFWTSYVKSV
jgi:hypothetical protein